MKINLMGAELFHTDGRTDMTKLIVAFFNFANAPKKETQERGGRREGSKRRKTRSSCRKLDELYKAFLLH
jgi:hypothetical protein